MAGSSFNGEIMFPLLQFGEMAGFNGAAPARARKSGVSREASHHTARFNGAAPARARKCDATASSSSRKFTASTGPRPRGRGNMMALRIISRRLPLQRGRARAEHGDINPVAESGRAASTGPRPRGRGNNRLHLLTRLCRLRFNGAAPARARNAESVDRRR